MTKNIQQSQGLGYFGKMIILEFLVDIIPGFYMFSIKTAYGAVQSMNIAMFVENLPEVMIHDELSCIVKSILFQF